MGAADCLFCKIAKHQIPAKVLGEANGLIAFEDVNPQAPTHILIIPVEHISTVADATDAHTKLLGQAILFANRLARQFRLTEDGYRLVINCGAKAGQTMFHLHLHLLGGREFQWPPG